ncbi:MAG: hypothetical protein V9H26_06790 [Verrucomicrobiota bacterium]
MHDLAFSPDGRLLASVSAGGDVKLWSSLPGREIADQRGLPWGRSHTADGRRLAYAHLPDWIVIQDTQSGRQTANLRRLNRLILTLAFRPDGRQLATSDGFGETAIWEVETGRLLRVLRGHRHLVKQVVYSRDGRRLITGSYDGTVRIWDLESGQELRVLASVAEYGRGPGPKPGRPADCGGGTARSLESTTWRPAKANTRCGDIRCTCGA